MIILYHSPQSRSFRTLWLLEELGLPYELKVVSIRRSDGTGQDAGPAYRDIHPHGKVPAIVHDAVTIFETAAIAAYLADLRPEAGLAPPIGDPLRGPYLTWLAYSSGVFEPAMICKYMKIDHVFGAMGWAPADEVEAVLDRAVASGPYLLGDRFSAADIVLGGSLSYMGRTGLMQPNPARDAYVERITGRDAYARAEKKDAG